MTTGRGPGGGTRLPGGPRGPEASRSPALHVVRGFRKGKYMTRWVAATSRAPGMPSRGQAQVPGGRGVRRLPPPWRTVGGPQSLARKGRATPPSPSACRLHFESKPRAEWLLPSRLPSRMTHVRERRQDGLAESQPRGGTPSKTRSPPPSSPQGGPGALITSPSRSLLKSFLPLLLLNSCKYAEVRARGSVPCFVTRRWRVHAVPWKLVRDVRASGGRSRPLVLPRPPARCRCVAGTQETLWIVCSSAWLVRSHLRAGCSRGWESSGDLLEGERCGLGEHRLGCWPRCGGLAPLALAAAGLQDDLAPEGRPPGPQIR